MKNKMLFGFLSLMVGFVSSCDDDDDNKLNYEATQFHGEWYSPNTEGETGTDLWIYNGYFKGSVFENLSGKPEERDKISGIWGYSPKSNVMLMDRLEYSSGRQHHVSYKVISLNEREMRLRSQNLGTEEVYYKIVENYRVKRGEVVDLSMPSLVNATFSSESKGVVNVDEQGKVVAVNPGVAFVMVVSEESTYVVKVEVESRVELFYQQVGSDIDDIISEYGVPDAAGSLGENMAILYNNHGGNSNFKVQYQYDDITREVTRVLTVYPDRQEWQNDNDEIKESYIEVDATESGKVYGKEDDYWQNEIVLSPYIVDGVCYISYQNLWYLIKYGHY